MTDCLIAEEIMDFVLQLFHKDDIHGIEEWNTFTPIELGVLSWHLGNFCGDASIGLEVFTGCSCPERDRRPK